MVRAHAERAGAQITEVDGSHVIMISQPQAVTDVIESAIAKVELRWTRCSFGPVQQIDAGPLDVGYVDVGPADGQPVVLLHGWPYDIHSYAEVAPALGAAGYRVIVPYLRGYGTTRFLLGRHDAQRPTVGLGRRRDRSDGRA